MKRLSCEDRMSSISFKDVVLLFLPHQHASALTLNFSFFPLGRRLPGNFHQSFRNCQDPLASGWRDHHWPQSQCSVCGARSGLLRHLQGNFFSLSANYCYFKDITVLREQVYFSTLTGHSARTHRALSCHLGGIPS